MPSPKYPKYYLNTVPRDGYSYWKFTGESKEKGEFFFYSKSRGSYKVSSRWSLQEARNKFPEISENELTLLLLEQ